MLSTKEYLRCKTSVFAYLTSKTAKCGVFGTFMFNNIELRTFWLPIWALHEFSHSLYALTVTVLHFLNDSQSKARNATRKLQFYFTNILYLMSTGKNTPSKADYRRKTTPRCFWPPSEVTPANRMLVKNMVSMKNCRRIYSELQQTPAKWQTRSKIGLSHDGRNLNLEHKYAHKHDARSFGDKNHILAISFDS